jgi:hypothetical protein
MRWCLVVSGIVMHAACSHVGATPDAIQADAMLGGLTIELVAKHSLPHMPSSDVEIQRVVLGSVLVRVIGDAAPGDVRTTRSNFKFDFDPNPVPITFVDAPTGLYSMLDLRIARVAEPPAQASDACNIFGRVVRAGNSVKFEIKNTTADVSVAIPINTDLAPRELDTTSIEVDVASLISGIDWDAVPLTGEGNLFIGDGDPQMAGVVAKLATAFRAR